MRKLLSIIILTAAVFGVYNLSAEVYLLGRGRHGGNGTVISRIIENDKSPLHTETVLTDGKKFTMEIYQSRSTLDEIYKKLLQTKSVSTKLAANEKMVRYRCELPNKMVEHLLFADSGKNVLIFRILLPQNFSAGKSWHHELPPLPGGAKSELVLELPQRKSVFGLFNNAFGTPQGNLRAVLSNLSDEWYVSADESLMPNGRGAMLTGKKNGIMLVGFSEDGTGFFYLKK